MPVVHSAHANDNSNEAIGARNAPSALHQRPLPVPSSISTRSTTLDPIATAANTNTTTVSTNHSSTHTTARITWPIFTAVIVNLFAAAVIAFSLTFFPLLDRHVDIALASGEAFANTLINNALDQVERAMSTCARGFESLDSAGIQNLYIVDTPSVSKYWMLRARLVGDLTLWLTFDDGTAIFVGRNVPCDNTIPRTRNATTVWVTELYSNGTFYAEQWLMRSINTSLIPDSRIGPFPTPYRPRQTPWYQDYVNSIYAHWRSPEVDTLQQFTAMRIGAQGGLNTTAKYCVYMAEVDSDALTQLLSAIYVSQSGQMVIIHTATGSLLGANFPFNSLVNNSASGGVLRPRRFTEVGSAAPLMADVLHRFENTILNCSSPCELDAGVSFDKLFVRVRHLESQDLGLDVRVVIAMRAIDFLQDIKDTESWSLSVTLPALLVVVAMFAVATWLTIHRAGMFLRFEGRRRSRQRGDHRSSLGSSVVGGDLSTHGSSTS
ncbi:transmembrane protein, putative [Bodo saltans]|uniref:Transmembrane protein, putative n=1 Tax=Bodo saltans TaxID=75058 RepID=A0A0S4IR44_BODSA|nr:transmembrane protein, putative [Bodo saltans]|eukprot:CUE72969.1 transmembrane protein, putative [Bodo saltans]